RARIEGAQVGEVQTEQVADLHHRAEYRVDLQRPAAFEVLQHGRLVRANLRRSLQPLLDADLQVDADSARDAVGLAHGRRRDRAGVAIARDVLQGGPRERADRVENSVPEQLQPQLVTNAGANGALQASACQHRRKRLAPFTARAIEFADRKAVAFHMFDDARLDQTRGRIHDAADDPLHVDAVRYGVIGVCWAQASSIEWSTMLGE